MELSLMHRAPVEVFSEMVNTLIEYRLYCQAQNQKFLAYLIDMALIEATSQQNAVQDKMGSGQS